MNELITPKDVEADGELYDLLVSEALRSARRICYRKKDDHYEIFCTNCQRIRKVTYKEIRVLQSSKVCPMCHMSEMITCRKGIVRKGFVLSSDVTLEESLGWRVFVEWDWDKKMKTSVNQVLYVYGDEEYRKNIVKSMYWQIVDSPTDGWRKIRQRSYNKYSDLFYWLLPPTIKTRREYYEEDRIPLKSNQMEFVKKYALNHKQLAYIRLFDLKSIDELLKYTKYIREGAFPDRNAAPLNITYLDYLDRNHISLVEYMDYRHQCAELGIKPEKPKDFNRVHQRLSEELKLKETARYENQISQRKKTVSRIGGFTFKSFTSAKEMVKCGTDLRICIGGKRYVSAYADGKTDLFRIIKDGKTYGALEIREGHLIQARGYANRDIENVEEVKKFVKKAERSYA